MEAKGRKLGPARTNFDDYVGTVAAGDAEAVWDLPSLNELEKIDRDRYTMVGIDVRVDGPTTAVATVYAIDRLDDSVLSIRLRDRPTLAELGRSSGEIPVVKFGLPEEFAGSTRFS
jgi:hypothetical protein